jgi:gliding motility-associated protein GldM
MSGAKNCPETTRQKMIGMMYLVLTAMLALNVSTQVLKGFTLVDESLHQSIESSQKRNLTLYQIFEAAKENNEKKVQEWLDKANIVKQKSNELYDYIENFKVEMLNLTGIADSLKQAVRLPIDGIDNLDISHDYVISKKHGEELKTRIIEFREFIIKTVFEGDLQKSVIYNEVFSTKEVEQKDGLTLKWEEDLFSETPVSAAIALLTKYQNDVRSAESDMVQYLFGRTDSGDFRVNQVKAFVIPNSRNVFRGGKFHADIVLAAVDSTSKPKVYVNGVQMPVSGTTGTYEGPTSRLGIQKFTGYIEIEGEGGGTYPFDPQEYMVSEPSATISNEDLNVVFLGLENKFSVSVPGVAPDNIRIDVSGAGASVSAKGSGKYTIKPSQMGEVKVNVLAKVEGKEMPMGSNIFKVKRLPRPSVFLQDKNGAEKEGSMSIADLKGATVIASYGPDAVVAANFSVISFTMSVEGLAPKNVTGQKLDQDFLNKLTRGKNLVLSSIMARGPGGGEQTLGAIVIKAM